MTQDQLAETLGVSQTTVGRWLKKDIVPTGDDLVKIANRFGVTIDWLMGRDETPAPNVIRDAPLPDPILPDVLAEVGDIRERMKVLEAKLRRLNKY